MRIGVAGGVAFSLFVQTRKLEAQPAYEPYFFSTLAGAYGSVNGPGPSVRLYQPVGIVADANGNLYVSDLGYSQYTFSFPGGGGGYNALLKIGPSGMVTTLAGGSYHFLDEVGTYPVFSAPSALAVDGNGNVFVYDSGGIFRVTPGGVVTAFGGVPAFNGNTGGVGPPFGFVDPQGLAADSVGNVYAADSENDTILEFSATGVMTTLAGTAGVAGSADGTGAGATFNDPCGLAVDSAGNVYVTDAGNGTVRMIAPGGVVTTLAGSGVGTDADGIGSAAKFGNLSGIAVDGGGNVFVADSNEAIRKIAPGGVVTTLAHVQGRNYNNGAAGLAVDGIGNVYVADIGNGRIWKVTQQGVVTSIAGVGDAGGSADGVGAAAQFNTPFGVAVGNGSAIYVADSRNGTIRKVMPDGAVTTVAGIAGFNGFANGTSAATAQFSFPSGVAEDASGNIYVADSDNTMIRKIAPNGVVTTVAGSVLVGGGIGGPLTGGGNGGTGAGTVPDNGDGTGAGASFGSPTGIEVDGSGNIYVGDAGYNTIRKVTPTGVVTTLAGTAFAIGNADGTGGAAQFSKPSGVAVDGAGNVYVADTGNSAVRKITPAGVVTTLPGNFSAPSGIAVDGGGNVFVADSGYDTIMRISSAGVVTILGGTPHELSGWAGGADGSGAAAQFNTPMGLAVDGSGNVYVADTGNNLIRVGVPNVASMPQTEPAFASQPVSQTIAAGDTVVFSVSPASASAPDYQWYLDGNPINGATSPSLLLADASAASSGEYYCVETNSLGTATASAELSVVSTPDPGRLINLSCRTLSGSGANPLIAGFVIGGAGTSGSQAVLIRASGPALGPFDVDGFLPDPDLKLESSSSGDVVASNAGWGGDATIASAASVTGAFPWTDPSSHDAGMVETLLAGPYTALISGASGDTGVVLAEVYDATPAGTYTPATPHLINISARNTVGTGANVLIAGFVIGGTTSKTVLIRASGPALGPFDVPGVLPDPQLQLFSSSTLIAANTGWGADPNISSIASSAGAFSWGASATADSAILITLQPGAYTAVVSGASGDSGVALVEVYEVQ